jgi:predicted 2-oxoglutarate/Fe(II)-dependent dioxygenase YbiX
VVFQNAIVFWSLFLWRQAALRGALLDMDQGIFSRLFAVFPA